MQVIIPMSGFGERFRAAGYTIPKPLIDVDGSPIIAHIIDLFPGEARFLFICNHEHLEEPRYRMREILNRLKPTGRIVAIDPHRLGPAHAVSMAREYIEDRQPCIVNYCDFSCFWDYSHFCKFVKESRSDGCIPAYRGFHPHMLGTTNYAFMREHQGWAYDIQEKKPFTENRMQEFASSGTYYFASGKMLKHYIDRTIEQNLHLNGEYYMSLVYKPMFADKMRVSVYPLQHFLQWGTPEDLSEYNYFSKSFKALIKTERPGNKIPATLLMPMAGAGSRFVKEGYKEPKPLIQVSGRPMVAQAALDLPQCSQQVFILRKDLPDLESIQSSLSGQFPASIQVVLEALTDGQARTCVLGVTASKLKPDMPLIIGACDNGLVYDCSRFDKLFNASDTDIIAFAIRGYPGASRNPTAYGWIAADGDIIKNVSVKIPLENPKVDPIILGSFVFKRADDFIKVAEQLFRENLRVNNEFYVDSCINVAISQGMKCRLLEVDAYLCWGTPDDLKTFEYWQSCYDKLAHHPYALSLDKRIAPAGLAKLKEYYSKTVPEIPDSKDMRPYADPV